MDPKRMMMRLASLKGAGLRKGQNMGRQAMSRVDPHVMSVGRWGGVDGMDDAAIRRRGQFRLGVGMGAVGLSSAVSGVRAKSSGGYTGANTY